MLGRDAVQLGGATTDVLQQPAAARPPQACRAATHKKMSHGDAGWRAMVGGGLDAGLSFTQIQCGQPEPHVVAATSASAAEQSIRQFPSSPRPSRARLLISGQ